MGWKEQRAWLKFTGWVLFFVIILLIIKFKVVKDNYTEVHRRITALETLHGGEHGR